MPLIYTLDSEIRPQDLTLDYYLEATPVNKPGTNINMTGMDSYKIGPYLDSLGFGITSIEIDVKPNLQPVVNISFKDLYGNLIFSRNKEFNYDVLFELPYPKFRLYVKGYLGKPVTFLLQVKSVKTNFQASDGSYEIKAEFIPNVFGFFNDIPYQYLFAVKGLKEKFGETTGGGASSIIEIAKNGTEISQKIRQAEDKYAPIREKMSNLNTSPEGIAQNFNDKKLSFDSIAGDDALRNAGFSGITFNIDINQPNGQPYTSIPAGTETVYGTAILASINSPTKINVKDGTKTLSNFLNTEAGKNQVLAAQNIIKGNIEAISKAASTQAFSSVETKLIDSQSIYNVMTRLAGDCAYVLGYILEGGLNGYNGDPGRPNNIDIFGNFYPLVEQNNIGESSALGEQIPWSQAKTEIEKVEIFVKALYDGTQQAQVVIDEAQGNNETPEALGGMTSGPIVKRITNAEVIATNPYSDNVDQIITNVIQRAGLIACGYGGSINSSNGTPLAGFVDGELANFKDVISSYRGEKKQQLKSFCDEVRDAWDSKGNFKAGKNFNSKTKSGSSTLKAYFGAYFSKFPKASETAQFSGGQAESLISLYTYNNGALYWNPKSLATAFQAINPNANNRINGGGKGEILVYVTADKKPTDKLDSLTTDTISDDTAPIAASQPKFYQWFSLSANPINAVEQSVFVNYEKLFGVFDNTSRTYSSSYFSPNDLIVKYQTGTNLPSGVNPTNPGDYMFRLLDAASTNAPKDWVVNLNDAFCRSYLYYFVDRINTIVSKTDAQQDEEAKKEAKASFFSGSGGGGVPVSTETSTGPEPYVRDEAQIKAVYVQFHHICQAWISLANTSGGDSLPSGTDIQLRTTLEELYRSNDPNANFYLNFTFPLVSEAAPGFEVSEAIVNTDPLLENNSQTSTLNMMQNICTLNNFLLQPIPGGVTNDLQQLFLPSPKLEYAVGRNALSIIWAPTPENRYTDNKNDPIYPEKGFFKVLDKVKQPVLALQFGSPNNVILKSIKAGTDDNKVTSESLQATSDIVNNQNQNKKKGFDCSMLAVMQGRSYKISLDIIGNAQIFPTMLLGIDGLPIFTGLYWVTEVIHKLTPNNMETTVEAMKMKYNGNGKFAAITPITKRNLSSYSSNGSGGGGGNNGTNSFGGDLNYEFVKKIKDIKLKNTEDIGKVVKEFTGGKYTEFTAWWNKECYGKTPATTRGTIDAAAFKRFWDYMIPFLYKDKYGSNGINFVEFAALHAIVYNESGGDYKSIREGVNGVTRAEHPGVAYAFDKIGDKSSYNKPKNKTALELFSDANFIAAHSSKKYGNDKNTKNSKDAAWGGSQFPTSLFSNVADAVATSPTFINEADFYKFSGRGYIQTTWRYGYEKVLQWILGYTGTDPIVKKYRDLWKPINNPQVILDKSSNADWDDLFYNSMEVSARAVLSHTSGSNYQYIDANQSKEQIIKGINNVAKKVNGGSSDYIGIHQSRVYAIFDVLYPQGATVTQNNSSGTEIKTPPVPAGFDSKVVTAIIKVMNSNGYTVYNRPYEVNIVGVRSETNVSNKFDDRLYIFWKNDKGVYEGADYPITTDPGAYYLNQLGFDKKSGAFIASPGQYAYRVGHHHEYVAMNPNPKIKGVRDTNTDNILDFNSKVESTCTDCNIHRANPNGTSVDVKNWSAGCQVFANSKNFADFIAYCQKHKQMYGQTFLYTLLLYKVLKTNIA